MTIVPLGFRWLFLVGSLWTLLLVGVAATGKTKKPKTAKKEQQPKAKKKKSKSMPVPKSRLQVLQAHWEQNKDLISELVEQMESHENQHDEHDSCGAAMRPCGDLCITSNGGKAAKQM